MDIMQVYAWECIQKLIPLVFSNEPPVIFYRKTKLTKNMTSFHHR